MYTWPLMINRKVLFEFYGLFGNYFPLCPFFFELSSNCSFASLLSIYFSESGLIWSAYICAALSHICVWSILPISCCRFKSNDVLCRILLDDRSAKLTIGIYGMPEAKAASASAYNILTTYISLAESLTKTRMIFRWQSYRSEACFVMQFRGSVLRSSNKINVIASNEPFVWGIKTTLKSNTTSSSFFTFLPRFLDLCCRIYLTFWFFIALKWGNFHDSFVRCHIFLSAKCLRFITVDLSAELYFWP